MKRILSILTVFVLLAGCAGTFAEEESWSCPECGASNTTKFCIKCGTKRPELKTIICPGCGTQYPMDTDAVFCGECGTKLLQDEVSKQYEGDGFDTPEDAALCYLAGLKNLDFSQLLSAFAWETQVDHYDYKAKVTRLRGIDPTIVPAMPAVNELLRSVMLEQIRSTQINYICRSLENYVNDEMSDSPTMSLVFQSETEIDEYFDRCDNGKIENLATMKNIRFYTPDDLTKGKFSIEQNQKNYLKMNACYGADETKDIIIAADIGEDTVVVSPTVARYGDRWYVVNVSSMTEMIIGVAVNYMAFFVLPDETKELLKNVVPVATVTDIPKSAGVRIHYEGEGFDRPEDAVTCYLEGLKNGDVQQMMRAFAWETQISRYSLKDQIIRMKSVYYNSPIRMPSMNGFMADMNMESLRHEQSRRIFSSVRNYILEDEDAYKELVEGKRMDLVSEEDVDAFIRAFNNGKSEKLRQMHNIRLIDPSTAVVKYNNESTTRLLDMYQRIYGADEIKEIIAIADLDGEDLAFNPTLARYGDKWYIVSLDGIAFSILGIDFNGRGFVTVKGSAELALALLQP